jgi:lipoate-protein ligase A
LTTAAEEQAWNARKLAETIAEPEHCVWMYREAAVVLGSSQRTAAATLTEAALPIVVRSSGGGAVIVGPSLVSVSVALPNHHALVTRNLVDSYRWIGEAHARVLVRFGVGAEATSPVTLPGVRQSCEIPWACFGSLSPWEGDRSRTKETGGTRTGPPPDRRPACRGTLIGTPQWGTLVSVMGRPAADGDRLFELTTTCERELGRPMTPEEFALALHEELRVSIFADTHLCSKPS